MPIDKVLSVSIANAAINASAISNTANLVIGALNTGNTVVTGNLTSNTLTLTVAGGQYTFPVNVVLTGNGTFQRVINSYNSNLSSNDSLVTVMGYYPNNYNAGYIAYNHQGVSSTNNFVGIGLYNRDYVLNVTARGSVGINTITPIPHTGNNGLIVNGVGSRGIIEVWEGAGSGGKAVFQQVDGATFVGNLAKGTGNGSLILVTNGNGTDATQTMTLFANSDVLIGDPIHVGVGTGSATPNMRRLRFDNTYDGSSTTDPTGTPANKVVLHNQSNWVGGFGISDGTLNVHSGGNTVFYRSTNTTSYGLKTAVFTNNGHVLKPYQPMFIAAKSTNEEPTSQIRLAFDQLVANNGAHYSTSNSTFTAPATGTYIFSYRGWFREGRVGVASIWLYKNGGTYSEVRISQATSIADYTTFTPSWTVKLVAGDYIDIRGSGGANGCLHTSTGITYSEFSGYLLG